MASSTAESREYLRVEMTAGATVGHLGKKMVALTVARRDDFEAERKALKMAVLMVLLMVLTTAD